jgi:hypothetical protein
LCITTVTLAPAQPTIPQTAVWFAGPRPSYSGRE